MWRYYHVDHLGAPTHVTDWTGAPSAAGDWSSFTRFHPYGAVFSQAGDQPAYGFAGILREPAAELGLVRMGARWYAPKIGRWITPDPLFLQDPAKAVERPLELNLYSYASNSPVVFVDPSGLDPIGTTDAFRILFWDAGSSLSESQLQEYRQNPVAGNATVASAFVGAGGAAASAGLAAGSAVASSGAAKWVAGTAAAVASRVAQSAQNAWNRLQSAVQGLLARAPTAADIPGRVQSRINISNAGFKHVLDTHFDPSKIANKSQFTVSPEQLRSILSAKETVQSAVRMGEVSGNYIRTITTEGPVGQLAGKFGGAITNTLSVVTDKFGNLLSAFPDVAR